MTLLRMSAPATVAGRDREIGEVVEVQEPGSVHRLISQGLAVEVQPDTDTDTGETVQEAKAPGAPRRPGPSATKIKTEGETK